MYLENSVNEQCKLKCQSMARSLSSVVVGTYFKGMELKKLTLAFLLIRKGMGNSRAHIATDTCSPMPTCVSMILYNVCL